MMRVRVYDKLRNQYFKSEVYAVINLGYYEKQLVLVPSDDGEYFQFFDYLDKTDKELPVLINCILPETPNDWIYKKSSVEQERLAPYDDLLKPEVRFFEYHGFGWLWEDTDTLSRLLNGESVRLQHRTLEGKRYSDLDQSGWSYIETQKDADAFLTEVCGFHDAVISEMHYISGAMVDSDHVMSQDKKQSISLQIQSQQCRNFEMEFEKVTALNLRPARDNEMGNIYEASLVVKNASVFFFDDFAEEFETNETGTWITAYSLRWRFTEE